MAAVFATAAAAFFVHTPYSLLLPGQAIDLRTVIAVRGYAPPAARFDLTDVSFVPSVPPLALLAALEPGALITRTSDVVPSDMSGDEYERAMVDSMTQSQRAATYVAERAAGYRMGPLRERAEIVGVLPHVPASGSLRPGDVIAAVDGVPMRSVAAVRAATVARKPGEVVRMTLLRGTAVVSVTLRLTNVGGRARLGVYLVSDTRFPPPAVPVTFKLTDVSGSSGGLMFAIDIYRSLEPARSALHVAGTGTLDARGNVGEIAGTMQKLVAARSAGAGIFLVPRQNYDEVKNARGIRVIPVGTFAQAVAALDSI